MFELTETCIFDESHDHDLNTVMEIVVEGQKCKVAICSECEDDATPKAIKVIVKPKLEAAKEKLDQLEALKKAAAELGFDLVKTGSTELMIPTQQPIPDPTPVPKTIRKSKNKNAPTIKVGDSSFKVQKNTRHGGRKRGEMSKEEATAALDAAKRTAEIEARGGQHESPTKGQAPSYRSHQLPDQIKVNTNEGEKIFKKPEIFAKEMQVVRGRAGVPTTIPKNIQGADGSTTITIVNSGGMEAIKRRTDALKRMRMSGDDSYYSQTCVVCTGSGKGPRGNCHTCKGTGILN